MKKFCIIFILLFIIILTAAGFVRRGGEESETLNTGEYFRIHIRADSNDEEDQAVKYLVRDRVVEYLAPLISSCPDKASAMLAVKKNLGGVVKEADAVLKANGFSYTSSAKVVREEFPLRVYEEVTLEAGEYDSLIVELGSGEGDNWWCVIYPPLCFTSTTNVVYRSKIAEMIREFFGE